MDLIERLETGLEPLGGPLLLERFMEALAAARAREEAAATARAAVAPTAREPMDPEEAGPPPTGAGRKGGGMEMEIEDFLNRDTTEGTSDDEIQEFLKDRRGFDPDDVA